MFKSLTFIVLALSCAAAALAGAPASEAPAPVAAGLDGTWLPLTAQLGGQPFPEAVLATMKLVLAGDTYTVFVGGNPDKGKVTKLPDTTPPALDITGVEGPNAGRSIPAIFHAHGDTLEICYNLGGAERPRAFATTAGTQEFLVVYRRVRP